MSRFYTTKCWIKSGPSKGECIHAKYRMYIWNIWNILFEKVFGSFSLIWQILEFLKVGLFERVLDLNSLKHSLKKLEDQNLWDIIDHECDHFCSFFAEPRSEGSVWGRKRSDWFFCKFTDRLCLDFTQLSAELNVDPLNGCIHVKYGI